MIIETNYKAHENDLLLDLDMIKYSFKYGTYNHFLAGQMKLIEKHYEIPNYIREKAEKIIEQHLPKSLYLYRKELLLFANTPFFSEVVDEIMTLDQRLKGDELENLKYLVLTSGVVSEIFYHNRIDFGKDVLNLQSPFSPFYKVPINKCRSMSYYVYNKNLIHPELPKMTMRLLAKYKMSGQLTPEEILVFVEDVLLGFPSIYDDIVFQLDNVSKGSFHRLVKKMENMIDKPKYQFLKPLYEKMVNEL